MFESAEQLQYLVTVTVRVCKKRKSRVNVNKNMVIGMGRKGAVTQVNNEMDGEIMQVVSSLICLEVCLGKNGGLQEDVIRVAEVLEAFNAMRMMFEAKSVSLSAKMKLIIKW